MQKITRIVVATIKQFKKTKATWLKYFRSGANAGSPDEQLINCGLCYDFADAVVRKMGKKTRARRQNIPYERMGKYCYGSHAWVRYRGKCYDSECPEGTKCWWNIPFFKRDREKLRKP